MQCFPVGQPDGGHDAISYIKDGQNSKFIVYQVKYVRKPEAEKEPHKWLLATMKEELPKLRKLISRGAAHYYLLTNVNATAHLDCGSIDTLNSTLSKELSVPFMCLWRDDICRRLDGSWDIKWSYPDIMTGPDVLKFILENGLSEDSERRVAAIRAFVTQQFAIDTQVKFRQIELQNNLLDLFVDVPIGSRDPRSDWLNHYLMSHITHVMGSTITNDKDSADSIAMDEYDTRYGTHSERIVGAAEMLLSPRCQSVIPHCVIEGAPGQGKSTIAQYVCQVHRLKLLQREDLLEKVPAKHKVSTAVRLPIKIDLRDFATWLRKENPFESGPNTNPPEQWKKSLEAFVAALISFHSGGAHFTADDLIAVCKLSAVLIIFDGLDEVADIDIRKDVVDEIVKGVQRLEANAASLQTIVTSRPAASANSPGMPEGKFIYLNLQTLTGC